MFNVGLQTSEVKDTTRIERQLHHSKSPKLCSKYFGPKLT